MVKKVSFESANGYRALRSAIQKRRLARAIQYLCIKFAIQIEDTLESVEISLARHANIKRLCKFVKQIYKLPRDESKKFEKEVRNAVESCTSGVPSTAPDFTFILTGTESLQTTKLLAKVQQLNEKRRDKSKKLFVNLILNDTAGKVCHVYTPVNSEISQLYQYAAVRYNTPTNELRLLFDGKTCDLEATTKELGISEGATLLVVNSKNDVILKDPLIEIFFRDSKANQPISTLVDMYSPISEAFKTYTSIYSLKNLDFVQFVYKGIPMDHDLSSYKQNVHDGDYIDVIFDTDVVCVSINSLDGQIYEYYQYASESMENIAAQFAKECDKDITDVKLKYKNQYIDTKSTLEKIGYCEGDHIHEGLY